jgi:hypothetical protein
MLPYSNVDKYHGSSPTCRGSMNLRPHACVALEVLLALTKRIFPSSAMDTSHHCQHAIADVILNLTHSLRRGRNSSSSRTPYYSSQASFSLSLLPGSVLSTLRCDTIVVAVVMMLLPSSWYCCHHGAAVIMVLLSSWCCCHHGAAIIMLLPPHVAAVIMLLPLSFYCTTWRCRPATVNVVAFLSWCFSVRDPGIAPSCGGPLALCHHFQCSMSCYSSRLCSFCCRCCAFAGRTKASLICHCHDVRYQLTSFSSRCWYLAVSASASLLSCLPVIGSSHTLDSR